MVRWGRTADSFHAAALASHVACCGAPLAINIVGLLFGAGLLSSVSPWVSATHEALHSHEIVLLGISFCFVVLGGATQLMSWRADCGADACGHEPCAPKKPKRLWVYGLVITLFLSNVGLYVWHHHDDPRVDAPSAAVEHVDPVA